MRHEFWVSLEGDDYFFVGTDLLLHTTMEHEGYDGYDDVIAVIAPSPCGHHCFTPHEGSSGWWRQMMEGLILSAAKWHRKVASHASSGVGKRVYEFWQIIIIIIIIIGSNHNNHLPPDVDDETSSCISGKVILTTSSPLFSTWQVFGLNYLSQRKTPSFRRLVPRFLTDFTKNDLNEWNVSFKCLVNSLSLLLKHDRSDHSDDHYSHPVVSPVDP